MRRLIFAALFLPPIAICLLALFGKSSSTELAYEVGSIYAGIIIGTNFTLFVQPFTKHRGDSLKEFFNPFIQRRRYYSTYGNLQENISIITIFLLCAITIIENYTFFGQSLGSNPVTAVKGVAIIGAIYAFILVGLGMWFDFWIWQGKLQYYVIAFFAFFFLLSIVVSVSEEFLQTPFFAVGMVSRAIATIVIEKWHYQVERSVYKFAYISTFFLLIMSFSLRLLSMTT